MRIPEPYLLFSGVSNLGWVQVDLAREARHLWQFNYNFRHSRHVTFPYPVYPLVSDEVLVETFEARPACPCPCPWPC